jgi:drug/metabolite transporter (DMT)-like permease
VLLTLACLFWAGNFVIARAMHAEIPPIGLAFWRWTLALAVLAPFVGPLLWRHQGVLRRYWLYIASLGATGIAGFPALLYLALTATTSVNALIFFAASPVLIAPISWILLREQLGLFHVIGSLCSLTGAVLVIAQGAPMSIVRNGLNPGDLVMLVAVPVWALYTVLLKRRPTDLPQLPTLTASIIAGVLLLSPIYCWRMAAGEQLVLTTETMLSLLYVAIGASLLGFACWSRGIAVVGPNSAGNYLHLTPIFGVGLAFVFLHERLALYHLVGAMLVFSGLMLAGRATPRDRTD